jgi:hypothetical protein
MKGLAFQLFTGGGTLRKLILGNLQGGIRRNSIDTLSLVKLELGENELS